MMKSWGYPVFRPWTLDDLDSTWRPAHAWSAGSPAGSWGWVDNDVFIREVGVSEKVFPKKTCRLNEKMMMMMINRWIQGLSQHVQTNPKLQLSCLEARVPSAVGNAATTGCWLNPTFFSEKHLESTLWKSPTKPWFLGGVNIGFRDYPYYQYRWMCFYYPYIIIHDSPYIITSLEPYIDGQ